MAALLGVGATVLFGLLPALRLSDVDPMTWLKHRAAGHTPRLTAGRLLLAGQIAVSVPLVAGAATAAHWPARRAAKTDALDALREE